MATSSPPLATDFLTLRSRAHAADKDARITDVFTFAEMAYILRPFKEAAHLLRTSIVPYAYHWPAAVVVDISSVVLAVTVFRTTCPWCLSPHARFRLSALYTFAVAVCVSRIVTDGADGEKWAPLFSWLEQHLASQTCFVHEVPELPVPPFGERPRSNDTCLTRDGEVLRLPF